MPHFYERLADIVGPAYLRYSFTRGTESEVTFLADALGLAPGHRVLDVGCGPGRHSHALARRGIRMAGVDVAQRFDHPPPVAVPAVWRDDGSPVVERAERQVEVVHAGVDQLDRADRGSGETRQVRV